MTQTNTVQQVIESGIPASGLRVYESEESQALGRAAAYGVMAPVEDALFSWQWVRFDGGMDFFKSADDAARFLTRNYDSYVAEVA